MPQPKLAYNFLGKCGLKVTNICLGTMAFGEGEKIQWKQTDPKTAHELLDRYVEWGGNFIDTADIYTGGTSESIVGNWLQKQNRADLVLGTKCRMTKGPGPNREGLGRRTIIDSVNTSLERLKTHYIDLLQLHFWDAGTPLEETLRTLSDLVRCGKIHYIGVSNLVGWQMQKVVDLSRHMGLEPIVSLQQQYSLVCRESELESLMVCRQEGVGVLAWSPLKGGLLAGKYQREVSPTEGRFSYSAKGITKIFPAWEPLAQNDMVWNTLAKLEEVAKKYEKTMAQVAIRWLIQKDGVSSVIVGATKLSQLDDNMAASTGWEISAEDMEALDKVSAPECPYPYGTYRRNSNRANPFHPQHIFDSVY